MRRQLVVGLDGLPSELLAWCFGLVLAHLPIVARPEFCRDGSRTVTSYFYTVAPEPIWVATGTRWSHPWCAQNWPIGRRTASRQRALMVGRNQRLDAGCGWR